MEFGFGDWMGGDGFNSADLDGDGWIGDDDDLIGEEIEDSDMLEDSDVAEEEEGDEEKEFDIEAALDENPDAVGLEDAALVGGLFGAAKQKTEEKEPVLEDLMNPLDAKDMEILADKGMSPIYRDNPEFGRFVWDRIHEDMKEADQELMGKVRKMKEK
jgi:hypothetical protein